MYPYDKLPYNALAYLQTDIAKSCASVSLFGLSAPSPATAKVLDIGCGVAENLISIADNFPDSKCLGFDLSSVQIDSGNKTINELGLKNISLQADSILEFNSIEKFDYIICHGVFSWVDDEVRKKILNICSNNLSENGVAYISYNTLPGWAELQPVCAAMSQQTKNITDLKEKIKTAREVFETLAKSQFLKDEFKRLSELDDFYVLHEYLAEDNHAFYFNDFVKMAEQNNLQYICDAYLPSMYGFMEKSESELDVERNRRFRSSLLCHKNINLDHNLTPEILADKFFSNNFEMGASEEEVTFTAPNGMQIATSDPVIITAIVVLSETEWANLSQLSTTVRIRLKGLSPYDRLSDEQISKMLAKAFLEFIFTGGVEIKS